MWLFYFATRIKYFWKLLLIWDEIDITVKIWNGICFPVKRNQLEHLRQAWPRSQTRARSTLAVLVLCYSHQTGQQLLSFANGNHWRGGAESASAATASSGAAGGFRGKAKPGSSATVEPRGSEESSYYSL